MNTEEILTENDVKENRKKKRRSRRSKQKHSLSASGSTCMDESSVQGITMSLNMTKEKGLCRCFFGTGLEKDDIESIEARESLSIYMWDLLKKKKILYSEAKISGLGPSSMSIYIPKLAIERRICYDEVEGLTVDWLDATSTLLLSLSMQQRSNRKTGTGKCRSIDEIALIVNPTDGELETNDLCGCCGGITGMITYEPPVFPLTLHINSVIPIAVHAVGGDDDPHDIVVRLCISSYYY